MSQNPRQDSLQNFYDHAAPQREKWIRRNQAFYNDDRAYMRFLIPEGLRILELGCGTASLLGELKPSSGVGVDLSPAMIEQAQKNWPNYEYVIGDIEDPSVLAGLEGPFDVVVLSDLLGNLSDVQQTLGRVHKLCTPSSRIIIAYYSPL